MDDALDQFLNELRCSICLEDLREAIMLPCSHRYCRECLDQVKSAECPLCKQSFVKRQMVRDMLIDRLVERAGVLREASLVMSQRPSKRLRTADEERLDQMREEFNRREQARLECSDDGGALFEGAVVLCCSNLDEDMQKLAEKLVRSRGRIASEWSPEVTHTVCGVDHEVCLQFVVVEGFIQISAAFSRAGRGARSSISVRW